MTDSAPSPTVLGGRYELTRRLARGGMADVFLATDRNLHRQVAVKVLFSRYASDHAFVARFQREAKAAAGLNHPNIVAVYDTGTEGQTHFMVMEYVDGRTLAEKVATEGPLGTDEAVAIASDVVDALAAAHRQGVVHRDIKPGNILLTPDGRAKVADFGIARAVEGDADLTETGLVMGTAAYFSPEQAQGRAIDPRSDLYSLGVVLFEMVTGTPPFVGSSDAVVADKQVTEPAPLARTREPSVPPDVEAIVATLLAKDPAQRYATAWDLRADLDQIGNRQQIHGAAPAQPAAVDRTAVMAPSAGLAPMAGLAPTGVMPPPMDGGDSGYTDGDESSVGSGWFVAAIAIILLLLIGGIILIANGQIGGGGDAAEPVVIPTLIGETQEAATALLTDAGLVVQTRFEANEEVEPGIVFAQDPEPGTELETGDTVTITVSATETTIEVPDVVGLTRDEAGTTLRSLGFVVTITGEPSDTVEAGRVISQSIEPGEEANSGAPITLVVSTGSDSQPVPSVVNLTQAAAEQALRDQGFVPQAELVDPGGDEGNIGRVLSQSPDGGQDAEVGSTVVIRVGDTTTTTTSTTSTTQAPSTTQTTQPATTSTTTSSTTSTTAAPTSTPEDPPTSGG